MNTFGTIFRIHIFGESHGKLIGIVIDGCPSGINLSEKDFEHDIARRKTGNKGTSPRIENDKPTIKSGVFHGKTTGSPILIEFKNNNIKSKDYSNLITHPRPGHADSTALQKFNHFNDYRGGGHFSGRITLGLVAAGVIAKKITKNISYNAEILTVNGWTKIQEEINKALSLGDSVGGIIECKVKNVPIGLGEPFFNSVESYISHLAFSIPGIKAIEFGAGFNAATMYGSQYNDTIINKKGETQTNNSGGINGGISNGNNIIFRVAMRPAASISKPQESFNFKTNKIETLQISGRHDTCIALRLPVIIEAITAIALADLILINNNTKTWNQ